MKIREAADKEPQMQQMLIWMGIPSMLLTNLK